MAAARTGQAVAFPGSQKQFELGADVDFDDVKEDLELEYWCHFVQAGPCTDVQRGAGVSMALRFMQLPHRSPETSAFGLTFLLTWNGQWGLIRGYEDHFDDVDRLCGFLKADADVQRLKAAYERFVFNLVDHLKVAKWVAAMEVCTRTLEHDEEVRLHFHMWMRLERATKLNAAENAMGFYGSAPHIHAMGDKKGGSCQNSGAYYLAVGGKKGSLFCFNNWNAYEDYVVQDGVGAHAVARKQNQLPGSSTGVRSDSASRAGERALD